MKLHLVTPPYTYTSPIFQSDPYSQRNWKFCRMMTKLGWEVVHYGVEGAEVECKKFDLVSRAEWDEVYGSRKESDFYYKEDAGLTARYNAAAVKLIQENASREDAILFTYGDTQKSIADRLVNLPIQVEPGCGYLSVFARYKVFESHPWQHFVYGKKNIEDGPHFDAVIPCFFDPEVLPMGNHLGDYFIYMGRIIPRKGVSIAANICQKLNKKLVIAGQGHPHNALITDMRNIEFIGPVNDPKKKAELLGNATAIFCPTQYFEPFGGVAIEAMMTGTPVISSNYGAFTETNIHGVTGWRCQLLDDYLWAAEHVQNLEYNRIRQYAIANYSMDRVAKLYDSYFTRLQAALEPEGWAKIFPNRKDYDWLATIPA